MALREETRWEDLRVRTMRAIEVLAPVIKSAHEEGAEVGLDFALYVGGESFTSAVSFSAADLSAFAGLNVTVSAFPVAEEAPRRKRKPARGGGTKAGGRVSRKTTAAATTRTGGRGRRAG